MDRQQREAELRTLLTSQRGKEELLAILKKQASMVEGNLPPFGTLLVETVLNYEYPTEGEPGPARAEGTGQGPGKTASETTEPGDVKFSEPPGRDAPGG